LHVELFLCGDLHLCRAIMNKPAMDQCPFCDATDADLLLPIVGRDHHMYDTDHMLVSCVLSLLGAVLRRLPLDLHKHFTKKIRKHFPNWTASGEGQPWNLMKRFIGWHEHKESMKPGDCALLRLIAVACRYGFPLADDLQTLTMRLLYAAFILTGRKHAEGTRAALRAKFCTAVGGLRELWLVVFNGANPAVCMHILEFHWPTWFLVVVPYMLRTEGGERLNPIHSKFWEHKTTRFGRILKQTIIPGMAQIFKDGCDTLLEGCIGLWYVARRRLQGGWPHWS